MKASQKNSSYIFLTPKRFLEKNKLYKESCITMNEILEEIIGATIHLELVQYEILRSKLNHNN